MSEPSSTKTRLVLERRHQLIDLNKEHVNFEINFECRSVDATKDFEMLVINQDQLNTIDLSNLVMKKSKSGYISGNIVADENRYQNYFLVIRSLNENENVEVDLDIDVKPIQPKENSPTSSQEDQPVVSSHENFVPPLVTTPTPWYSCVFSSPTHMILVIIVIVGIAAGAYYYYQHQMKSDSPLLVSHEGDDAVSVSSKGSSGSERSAVSSRSGSGSHKKGGLIEKLTKSAK